MMLCQPESTNIDPGGAKVNIGNLRSTSYHIQCHNSQQLFFLYNFSKQKSNNNKIYTMDYIWDSLEFLFFYMLTN